MSQYKTLKTTMGRKYRMRMAEDEVFERDLFKAALILLPLVTSVLFTVIFFRR